MRGLFGSIERSLAPASRLRKRMRSQVAPPSRERIDAALLVGAMRVAERGDIDEIGILWVDAHLGDVARLCQADSAARFCRHR